MDLKELETLIAIVEKGSISAAAAALGVSQPTASKRVRRLEDELGASLFAKGHRHSDLTPEGTLFYRAALSMLECRARVQRQIDQISRDLSGTVVISAGSIPGDYLLPPMLVEFAERYSGVSVHVRISDSQSALETLVDRKSDLAIVGIDRTPPGFKSVPFAEDELVLILKRGHPLANRSSVPLRDLASLRLVGRSVGSGTRQVWEKAYRGAEGTAKDIPLQLGHALAVVNAIAEGAEAGIVSRVAAAGHPGVVSVSFAPPLKRPLFLVFGLCETRAAETLVAFLTERSHYIP
ncbi:MAG: transcriptional regulator [Dethiosulfovibrio peptidovorans]|nr:MAG: transcriptional regulator [Dethiosulfovibrio peptidovorans]